MHGVYFRLYYLYSVFDTHSPIVHYVLCCPPLGCGGGFTVRLLLFVTLLPVHAFYWLMLLFPPVCDLFTLHQVPLTIVEVIVLALCGGK